MELQKPKRPWVCRKCGTENKKYLVLCENCYESRTFLSWWINEHLILFIFTMGMASMAIFFLIKILTNIKLSC